MLLADSAVWHRSSVVIACVAACLDNAESRCAQPAAVGCSLKGRQVMVEDAG